LNYYPFHIGDFASATRHLSWDENAAYRLMLDVYYTTEKPLPLEHRQVCRLILANTELQREAVQTVLDEFFVKTEEGWINTRADAEIEAMRGKQQKQRDKANAMWEKRRAATGTSTVPDHGIASALPQHQLDDAMASKPYAVAMPPTPIPTPIPTPTPKKEEKRASAPAPQKPEAVEQQTWDDWLALRRKKSAPVTGTVLREATLEAQKAGVSLERFLSIWCARGSQGLQADWLKGGELATATNGSQKAWAGAR